jgi:hypothetical protein
MNILLTNYSLTLIVQWLAISAVSARFWGSEHASQDAKLALKQINQNWAQRNFSTSFIADGASGNNLWDIKNDYDQYKYSPLVRPRKDIRLLRVICQHHERRFNFELIDVPIENPPPYIAISYTWGDSDATESIITNSNGQHLKLTRAVSHILDSLFEGGDSITL